MPSPNLVDQLRTSLQIYGQTYGWPASVEQRRGLISTLLRLTLQNHSRGINATEATQIVDQVMANPSISGPGGAIADSAQQALIRRAYQWQVQLRQTIKDTLTTYIQRYAPGLESAALPDVALQVIALVSDSSITPDEVQGLLGQVVDSFDLRAALAAQTNPTVEGIVQSLAIALSQKPLETAVSETVTAYVVQFAPTLKEIGEDLIEKAINGVLNHKVDFDFDADVKLVDRKILINQVSFKLNLMKQSPPPSKPAQRLAAELATEIQRLKQQRKSTLGSGDATQGLASNDGLSISSGWTSKRPPKSPKP